MPKLTIRRWLVATAMSVAVAFFAASRFDLVSAADTTAAAAPGAATVESLGTMLSSLKLKPSKTESRYDFQFAHKAKEGDEWELSMSVVLSNDTKTIWLMAWLDELPQNAAEVPRTALLRLLADNDRMGNGQFFAYVPSNRRFVLERIVTNQNVSATSLKNDLLELGKTVIGTHPHWATANWKTLGNTAPSASEKSDDAPTSKSTETSASKGGTTTRK